MYDRRLIQEARGALQQGLDLATRQRLLTSLRIALEADRVYHNAVNELRVELCLLQSHVQQNPEMS